MIDRDERWLEEAYREACGDVRLPPRVRWLPRQRRRAFPLRIVLASAAAVAVALAVGLGLRGLRESQVAAPTPSSVPSVTPATSPSSIDQPRQLPADEAWSLVRRLVPGDVTVLQPTWLPARFDTATVTIAYLHDPGQGWRYSVGYAGADGQSVIVARGTVNSWRPDSPEPIDVRGIRGTLSTTTQWPPVQVVWSDGDAYAIQSNGLTRDEMRRVVASLAPAPATVPPRAPVPVSPPDVQLIAASGHGDLERVTHSPSNHVTFVARSLPRVCQGNELTALEPSPDGKQLAIACAIDASRASVLIVDSSLQAAPVAVPASAIARADAFAWSPNGSQLALLAPGACVSPEPVCRQKILLYDVGATSVREILSERVLRSELRWTSLGLSYFQGYAGTSGAGTYVWNGTRWDLYSTRRLTAVNRSGRAVLVESDPTVMVYGALYLRTGAIERRLTPPQSDLGAFGKERLVALLDDGRAVAWRETGGTDRGTLVVYADTDGGYSSSTSYLLTGVAWGDVVGDWIFAVVTGKVAAYSLEDHFFVSLPDAITIDPVRVRVVR